MKIYWELKWNEMKASEIEMELEAFDLVVFKLFILTNMLVIHFIGKKY